MPADSALLLGVPLFERLDEDERALLASHLDEVRFEAGEHVFKRGDPGGALYIVTRGEVEIYVEDTTGARIVFETAKAGDFFGELSLLDGDPRSASALSLQASHALRVDRDDLTLLFTRHPHAAMDVMAMIGKRLREADRLLGSRPSGSPNEAVEERLTPLQRLADFAAAFSGTFTFLLVHVAVFAAWILVNLDDVPGLQTFDPYPFNFLTMCVSLEAIFLSCLVLISQNRQAAKDRIRSDVEYSANIRAGLEVTQLHVKVDQLNDRIAARMNALERQLAALTAQAAQNPQPGNGAPASK